jgi:hypothetical protein
MSNVPRRMVAQKVLVSLVLLILHMPASAQSRSRIVAPLDNNRMVHLAHSVHPLATIHNDSGRVDPNLAMQRMLLVLKPSEEQKTAVRKLINGQHDPQSPNYHWRATTSRAVIVTEAPSLREWRDPRKKMENDLVDGRQICAVRRVK